MFPISLPPVFKKGILVLSLTLIVMVVKKKHPERAAVEDEGVGFKKGSTIIKNNLVGLE